MRTLRLLVAIAIAATPAAARADFLIGASIGKSVGISPLELQPTTVMVAPGYSFIGDLLRLEIGLLGALPDGPSHNFDLEVRPSLVIDPPVLPVHFRVIATAIELLTNPTFAFGGALGVGTSLFGLGVFLEVGALPRARPGGLAWAAEGRAGAYYIF